VDENSAKTGASADGAGSQFPLSFAHHSFFIRTSFVHPVLVLYSSFAYPSYLSFPTPFVILLSSSTHPSLILLSSSIPKSDVFRSYLPKVRRSVWDVGVGLAKAVFLRVCTPERLLVGCGREGVTVPDLFLEEKG
jgi:hypothetical protein